MGYDHAYMIKYAEFAKKDLTDPFRIDVLETMINIVRKIDVSLEKSTNS